RWRTDPQHGDQFHPEAMEVLPPSSVEETAGYLGSGMSPQIGPVLARRIVAAFGDATLAVLDAAPQRVREAPGIGRKRAATAATAWVAHGALRAVAAFLAQARVFVNPVWVLRRFCC